MIPYHELRTKNHRVFHHGREVHPFAIENTKFHAKKKRIHQKANITSPSPSTEETSVVPVSGSGVKKFNFGKSNRVGGGSAFLPGQR